MKDEETSIEEQDVKRLPTISKIHNYHDNNIQQQKIINLEN